MRSARAYKQRHTLLPRQLLGGIAQADPCVGCQISPRTPCNYTENWLHIIISAGSWHELRMRTRTLTCIVKTPPKRASGRGSFGRSSEIASGGPRTQLHGALYRLFWQCERPNNNSSLACFSSSSCISATSGQAHLPFLPPSLKPPTQFQRKFSIAPIDRNTLVYF